MADLQVPNRDFLDLPKKLLRAGIHKQVFIIEKTVACVRTRIIRTCNYLASMRAYCDIERGRDKKDPLTNSRSLRDFETKDKRFLDILRPFHLLGQP